MRVDRNRITVVDGSEFVGRWCPSCGWVWHVGSELAVGTHDEGHVVRCLTCWNNIDLIAAINRNKIVMVQRAVQDE